MAAWISSDGFDGGWCWRVYAAFSFWVRDFSSCLICSFESSIVCRCLFANSKLFSLANFSMRAVISVVLSRWKVVAVPLN